MAPSGTGDLGVPGSAIGMLSKFETNPKSVGRPSTICAGARRRDQSKFGRTSRRERRGKQVHASKDNVGDEALRGEDIDRDRTTKIEEDDEPMFDQDAAERGGGGNTRDVWIMKPVGMSRGRGIRLVDDIKNISYSEKVIL